MKPVDSPYQQDTSPYQQDASPARQDDHRPDLVISDGDLGELALLAALRGQRPPVQVVATDPTGTPADLGAVEVLDGTTNITIPEIGGGMIHMASVYAHTLAGSGGGLGHVAADEVSEEWVVRDPLAFTKSWVNAELRHVPASADRVAGNADVLAGLKAESEAFQYAAVTVTYEGFPTDAAIDALKDKEPVGYTLHFYELRSIRPGGNGFNRLGGRLLRQLKGDTVTEHWLLATGYAFPQGVTFCKVQPGAWGTRYAFFDTARTLSEYQGGLYVQVSYTLGALP